MEPYPLPCGCRSAARVLTIFSAEQDFDTLQSFRGSPIEKTSNPMKPELSAVARQVPDGSDPHAHKRLAGHVLGHHIFFGVKR